MYFRKFVMEIFYLYATFHESPLRKFNTQGLSFASLPTGATDRKRLEEVCLSHLLGEVCLLVRAAGRIDTLQKITVASFQKLSKY